MPRTRSARGDQTAGTFLWSSVTEKVTENTYAKWEGVAVGDLVEILPRRKGVVRYIGDTKFAEGVWFGLELFSRTGRHSGMVKGIRYFTAAPKTAVFVPRKKIHKILRRAASIPYNSYIQANAEALDLFTGMLGRWKQAAHHLKHNTAFLGLEQDQVMNLHNATFQLRTALESLQAPTHHVRKRSSSDPLWRDEAWDSAELDSPAVDVESPTAADAPQAQTPSRLASRRTSAREAGDTTSSGNHLTAPRASGRSMSTVSKLSIAELKDPRFESMSMKRMLVQSGTSPRSSKYSRRIAKAVEDDPILLALSRSTRQNLNSKASLSQVIQELQKCIVLIEKYIPKITNQLNAKGRKQPDDSEVSEDVKKGDIPVYNTHVIQELLKRVQKREDIDSHKIRNDFSNAREINLEVAYGLGDTNLMVEVMAWIRNNITAAAVTDEKDAEMASLAAREVQSALKDILRRINSRPPSSVFSPQFGSEGLPMDLEDRFNSIDLEQTQPETAGETDLG